MMQTNFLRKWATPLTMGAFLLLSVTGVLMFFHLDMGLNKLAHEWLGWALVAGVVAHIMVNFASFKKHLNSPVGRGMVGLFALLLVVSALIPEGKDRPQLPMRVVMDHLTTAPLTAVAAIAKISPETLMERLKNEGISVDSPQKTLADLSGGNEKRARRLLGIAFGPDSD